MYAVPFGRLKLRSMHESDSLPSAGPVTLDLRYKRASCDLMSMTSASLGANRNNQHDIGEYLEFLAVIGNDFASSLDIGDTLSKALNRIALYMHAEAASLFLLEDNDRELVCRHLAGDGYGVTSEGTGLDGLRSLTADPPDALILDLGLPDLDGLDLLKMVRAVSDLPVLVLTAREDETTILAAFEGGADDYVVKPISGPQLSARVTALLRRGKADASDVVAVGGLEIRLGPREAELHGRLLDLTAKEFDLLAYLAARPGQVVSKEDLHAAVWKAPAGTEGRTIDVHLSTLRKKMSEKPDDEKRYLHTVIGAGVRLIDPEG